MMWSENRCPLFGIMLRADLPAIDCRTLAQFLRIALRQFLSGFALRLLALEDHLRDMVVGDLACAAYADELCAALGLAHWLARTRGALPRVLLGLHHATLAFPSVSVQREGLRHHREVSLPAPGSDLLSARRCAGTARPATAHRTATPRTEDLRSG
jgi:hypothetical protein